jgi:2-C-methyl-D-erythritol 4-phosphate cytidylyltransferase/2-C-methyl-D-erythritol 2,4-cyclodiphosphate synthase
MTIRNAAIIVAAGRGQRVGGEIPKQYLEVGGMPILRRTVEVFLNHPNIDLIQVIIHPDDKNLYDQALNGLDLPAPIFGGETRQQSVLNGLEAISDKMPEYVFIHDAARPFLDHKIIDDLIDVVEFSGAVIPGLKVRIIEGSENNFKITTSEDLKKAEMMTAKTYTDIRTGYGVDVHAFDKGDHVILGGVKIPHTHSLKGHSDADVALHALTDALLGSMALGDIGDHFPPSDKKWKGASSDIFLKHAADLIYQQVGVIAHVDLTIICETPKIGPHREKIRDKISEIIDLDIARVSVKATTTEKLGFTGKGEGIMAQAVATVRLPE